MLSLATRVRERRAWLEYWKFRLRPDLWSLLLCSLVLRLGSEQRTILSLGIYTASDEDTSWLLLILEGERHALMFVTTL